MQQPREMGCDGEGDCAEEEFFDNQECGQDLEKPTKAGQCLGYSIDRRPLLPFTLFTSTIVGAGCMFYDQIPTIATSGRANLAIPFGIIYGLTLFLGVYCWWSNPGETVEFDDEDGASNDGIPGSDAQLTQQANPPRSHKSWMYNRPVRRYDHYCRWLMNVIGFLNHREFIFMLVGLTLIGMGGVLVDAILLFLLRRPAADGVDPSLLSSSRWRWPEDGFVIGHLCYSAILTGLVAPILKIHVGLVTRNELACEWKHNEFYVIRKEGSETPVAELTDEEFNDRFNSFCYDSNRNEYDKGWRKNWQMFLCNSRGDECNGDF